MKIHRANDVAILEPHGWLMGGEETVELEKAIQELIAQDNRHLIIDLGEVRMINTNALAVLNHCRAMYKERGARLALCNVDAKINHVLVITKLALHFDTYPHRKEALAAMQEPSST